MSTSTYLHGSNEPQWRDNFPLHEDMFSKPQMSHARYQRIQQVWITPVAVKELNKAMSKVLILPEVLTIDEKLSPFNGKSPFI